MGVIATDTYDLELMLRSLHEDYEKCGLGDNIKRNSKMGEANIIQRNRYISRKGSNIFNYSFVETIFETFF